MGPGSVLLSAPVQTEARQQGEGEVGREEGLLGPAKGEGERVLRQQSERTVASQGQQHPAQDQRPQPPARTRPGRQQQHGQAHVEGDEVGEAVGKVGAPPVVPVGEGMRIAQEPRQHHLGHHDRVNRVGEGLGDREPALPRGAGGEGPGPEEGGCREEGGQEAGGEKARDGAAVAPETRPEDQGPPGERGLEDDLRPQRAHLQREQRGEQGQAAPRRLRGGPQERPEHEGRPGRRLAELDEAEGREEEAAEPPGGASEPAGGDREAQAAAERRAAEERDEEVQRRSHPQRGAGASDEQQRQVDRIRQEEWLAGVAVGVPQGPHSLPQ